jgi:rare lipoprotein A
MIGDQIYRPIVVLLHRHRQYLPTHNNRRIDNGSNFRGRVTMGVGPLKLKLTFLLLAAAGALVATNNPSLAAKSGVASIHSTKEGLKTASGARRSGRARTAAHRSVRFGSKVRVTNRRNGRALVATNNPSLAGQSGVASVYSTKEGLKTASGARLSDGALTAAHRSLPFGSKVRVTNRRNGRTIIVTINDRGPFVRGRIIDLTPAGARALGFSGLTQVTVERMG